MGDDVVLDVRDLKVSYGRIAAVKGVSFQVRQGEMVALIGANGFDSFKQVMRRVGDFEELLCRDLSGSGVGVVRKLNGGTFEAPATKFFT